MEPGILACRVVSKVLLFSLVGASTVYVLCILLIQRKSKVCRFAEESAVAPDMYVICGFKGDQLLGSSSKLDLEAPTVTDLEMTLI